MKRSYTPVLAVGIGAVAGLRALAAPAVLAWAAKTQMGFVWEIRRLPESLQPRRSERITDLAVSELIADKATLCTEPVERGAACVPHCCRARSAGRPFMVRWNGLSRRGAVLGGVGAIAGAFAVLHSEEAQPRYA